MKLNKLYLESISHLDAETQEIIINEAPHTEFYGEVPDELKLLRPHFVDLNFENYTLSAEEKRKIGRAFCGEGVAIPNTKYKIRNVKGISVVELATGAEQVLPIWWKRQVISSSSGVLFWIGKDVRPDQLANWDLAELTETEDGWERQHASPQAQQDR